MKCKDCEKAIKKASESAGDKPIISAGSDSERRISGTSNRVGESSGSNSAPEKVGAAISFRNLNWRSLSPERKALENGTLTLADCKYLPTSRTEKKRSDYRTAIHHYHGKGMTLNDWSV